MILQKGAKYLSLSFAISVFKAKQLDCLEVPPLLRHLSPKLKRLDQLSFCSMIYDDLLICEYLITETFKYPLLSGQFDPPMEVK